MGNVFEDHLFVTEVQACKALHMNDELNVVVLSTTFKENSMHAHRFA